LLERAGLIERGREAQWRPCPAPGQSAQDIATGRYTGAMGGSFDKLDRNLKELQDKNK